MAKKAKGNKGKKPKKKAKRQPRIVQGVGVLSSIPFNNTPLKTEFVAGLGSATLLKNVQDDLGYDDAALELCAEVGDGMKG